MRTSLKTRPPMVAALLFTLTATLFLCPPVSAENTMIRQMEFRDQSITDILLVLAEAGGVSIVPDETVSGTASFFFSESEFEEALALFLATYHLSYRREGKTYYVSRIAVSFEIEKNAVSLSADDVDLQLLVRALSKAIGKTVLFDALPRERMTVHIESLSPTMALEILTRRFGDYTVEDKGSYFYIRRIPANMTKDAPKDTKNDQVITRNGDRYSINLEKGRFIETLTQLFSAAGVEYSFLSKTDTMLENLYFTDRNFDTLLRLILEQGNADYIVQGAVYYIVELQRRDIVKKLKKTEVINLRYMQAQDLPTLLPSELGSGNLFRLDKAGNSVILTGSEEETGPIKDFIALIDRPLSGLSYYRFNVKYLKVKDLISITPQKLLPTTPVTIPDSNAFVLLGTDENRDALQAYIDLVDKRSDGYPVRLRYIKTEELIKNLPPSVSKEDVVDSGSPNMVFFVGSEDKRRMFLRELELIDRPKPQIRYELLVVQHQQSNSFDWSRSLDVSETDDGSGISLLSELTNVLNLKFDVIAQFGYLFSAQLNLELSETLAHVFADTTLNGLSGQDVKFQNTSTFRYREMETDEDTGELEATGVTREITSGLIVALNGWVSGDGMITMSVNATVSKQDESDSDSGDLPPTSERVVTTQVRTASGKPIIIGGLLQKEQSKTVGKTPLLGDIPFLGTLFRDVQTKEENTEMVIYIVPHLSMVDESGEALTATRMERYYSSFVRDYSE